MTGWKRGLPTIFWVVALGGVGVAYYSWVAFDVDPGSLISISAVIVGFATTGLVLVRKVPTNRIGWIYLVGGAIGGLEAATLLYGRGAVIHGLAFAAQSLVVAGALYFPWIVTTVSLAALLFPDGGPPNSQWRWALVPIAGVYLLGILALVAPESIHDETISNPWALDSLEGMFDVIGQMALPMILTALVVGPSSLIFRFHRSSGVERLQLKWLAFSVAVAGMGLGVGYLAPEEGPLYVVGTNLGILGLLAIPVATAIAIVHYRLYDIDRLISRTVVYGILVALLIGTYVGVVFLLSQFVPDENSITVAVATLAVAGLFNPLRRRIQDIIDRRLYRSQYDSQEIVEDFSVRLADEVDVATIEDELLDVLDETVKPEAAALWIRGGQRD